MDLDKDEQGVRKTSLAKNSIGGVLVGLAVVLIACLAIAWGLHGRHHDQVVAPVPMEAQPPQPTLPATQASIAPEAADDQSETAAEGDKQILTMQVRELLCKELGERYVKARTSIDLTRSIQLSQANGCGWKAIMAADARTHDLTKQALEAAGDIEEETVDYGRSGDAEADAKIGQMADKLEDMGRDVTDVRNRSYYRH